MSFSDLPWTYIIEVARARVYFKLDMLDHFEQKNHKNFFFGRRRFLAATTKIYAFPGKNQKKKHQEGIGICFPIVSALPSSKLTCWPWFYHPFFRWFHSSSKPVFCQGYLLPPTSVAVGLFLGSTVMRDAIRSCEQPAKSLHEKGGNSHVVCHGQYSAKLLGYMIYDHIYI